MNVLITGGGGFIGSHLVESQLRQGHRVRVIDLHPERLACLARNSQLEVVVGDLTDDQLVKRIVRGVEITYHLASAHLEISTSDARYSQVNVEATKNLLVAARDGGVQRVVHCSSVGVFGQLASLPANETTVCRPTNVYERTKLAGERAALDFSRQSGLPVVVARPAWVYGPRCPRTLKLFHTIQRGRFVLVGDCTTLRQPIYVADAVRGLELCAQAKQAAGQSYILAGVEPVTIQELVQKIAEVVGVPTPTTRIPVLPAKALGVVLETAFKMIGRQPPFSRRSVDFFLRHHVFEIAKAQNDLGFDPEINVLDGLQRTWQYLTGHQSHELGLAHPLPGR